MNSTRGEKHRPLPEELQPVFLASVARALELRAQRLLSDPAQLLHAAQALIDAQTLLGSGMTLAMALRERSLQRNRGRALAVRRKYTEEERGQWKTLRQAKYAGETARTAAKLIIEELRLDESAFETVRKAIG